MERGYIKLFRRIQDDPLYFGETFTKTHAFIDLLLLANHKEMYIVKRGIQIKIKRGQVGYGEEKLADRWKWSRGKVRRFLEYLVKDEKIVLMTVQKNIAVSRVIELVNYNIHQVNKTQTETEGSTENGRKTVQEQECKEGKEGKKDIKLYVPDEEHLKLAKKLGRLIFKNNPNERTLKEDKREKTFNNWANDFRLMIEQDKREIDVIEKIIEFSQSDPFFLTTIRSASKLRGKFDDVFMKMKTQFKKQTQEVDLDELSNF